MAKKRKYPKEPKRSASLETYNAELEKRKKEKERVIADAKRLKKR